MRILVTGYFYYPAPTRLSVQLEYLIQGMKRDDEVELCCLLGEGQAHHEERNGLRIFRVPKQSDEERENVEAFRRALGRQVESGHYQAVHFTDGWSGLTVLQMRAHLQYNAVYDLGRGTLLSTQLPDLTLATELERIEKNCLRRSDMVLSAHESDRNQLEAYVEAQRLHSVPLGVNVDIFDWEEPNTNASSTKKGYEICYQMSPDESFDLALARALSVLETSKDLSIRVLSSESVPDDISHRLRGIREILPEINIDLCNLDCPKRLPKTVANSRLCVMAPQARAPSPLLHIPVRLMEFWACRQTVIAPESAAVGLLCNEGVEALLYQSDDWRSLARGLQQLLDNEQERLAIAARGYAKAREVHGASVSRRKLKGAYEWMLAEKKSQQQMLRSVDGGASRLGVSIGGSEMGRVARAQTQFGNQDEDNTKEVEVISEVDLPLLEDEPTIDSALTASFFVAPTVNRPADDEKREEPKPSLSPRPPKLPGHLGKE